MQFHAVQASCNCVARGGRVFLDQRGNLAFRYCARDRAVGRRAIGTGHLNRAGDCRWSDHISLKPAIGRNNHPPAMHQLHNDPPAARMNCIGHPAPAFDLRSTVNARGPPVTLARRTGLDTLGHDQTGACSLGIVFYHQIGGDVAWSGPIARHRCHHDAIGECDIAQRSGRKKADVHSSSTPEIGD